MKSFYKKTRQIACGQMIFNIGKKRNSRMGRKGRKREGESQGISQLKSAGSHKDSSAILEE